MSGPFIDSATYSFDRIKPLPLFVTEGMGATPSLEGSRALAAYLRAEKFNFDYLELSGDHGGMVPMVMPAVFDRHRHGGRHVRQSVLCASMNAHKLKWT